MEENKNTEQPTGDDTPQEIIAAIDESMPEETTNPEQSTTQNDMETHSHQLHHAPGKKFWHYFYEFLMLFLAVFCGFIAENWREHFVERKKEKEYMHSMLADLKRDTEQLKTATTWLDGTLVATNETITLLNHEVLNDSIVKEIYRLDNSVFRFVTLELDDRTAAQLRNSGLRLILNKKVLDGMANYWYFQKSLYIVRDNLHLQKIKTRDIGLRIISQKYFTASSIPFEFTVTGTPKFLEGSEILLPEYYNRLVLCREVAKNCMRFYKKQSELAEELMSLIKREYHFE